MSFKHGISHHNQPTSFSDWNLLHNTKPHAHCKEMRNVLKGPYPREFSGIKVRQCTGHTGSFAMTQLHNKGCSYPAISNKRPRFCMKSWLLITFDLSKTEISGVHHRAQHIIEHCIQCFVYMNVPIAHSAPKMTEMRNVAYNAIMLFLSSNRTQWSHHST